MKQKQARKRTWKEDELVMPAQIPDTPENVAKALLNTPRKKPRDWDYLKEKRTA